MKQRFFSASRPVVRLGALLFFAALLLSNSSVVGEAVQAALDDCAHILIPSLFPFMVVSGLFVRLRSRDEAPRMLSTWFRRCFRLPGCATSAVLLGALCGFPIGAKMACELYQRGSLSRREAERLMALANNTGPAFIIEVVGVYYWHSRRFGLMLYIVQILSAWCIGWIAAKRVEKSGAEGDPVVFPQADSSFLAAVSDAISSSAQSMLCVCGFVAFFSVVSHLSATLLAEIGCERLSPLFAAILEFSHGSAAAAGCGGAKGAFLAGLAVGWSGICVFAQCQAFAAPLGLRMRFTALSKAIQGLLCGGAAAVWYRLHADTSLVCQAVPTVAWPEWALYIEITLLILFCLFPLPRGTYETAEEPHRLRGNASQKGKQSRTQNENTSYTALILRPECDIMVAANRDSDKICMADGTCERQNACRPPQVKAGERTV